MTAPPIVVDDVRLETENDFTTLSGRIGSERLFWSTDPRATMVSRGEPFVTALLVSAMTTGRDLYLPASAPVDAEFLRSIAELQVIYARWFRPLRTITIHAERIAPRERVAGRFIGYSGGIDSSYSVLRLANVLDGTVLLDGIEFGKPNAELALEVDTTLRRAMAARGLPLVTVRTNVKFIGRSLGGQWAEFIGGALASVPHALGFAEYWIAVSNSWENLRPYGTHPLTDPLWGSSQVRVHPHGAEANRIEKTRILGAEAPDLLAALRVCFQGRDYNCGRCHKCLKAAAALRALELPCPAMPPLDDPRLLRTLSVERDGDLLEWVEIMVPGLAARDPALARELRRLMRRYEWRQALRRIDALLFGGMTRRLLARHG